MNERWKKRNLIQAKLANLLQSSQSRVAKIEAGSSDVSLDLMFRSLFALCKLKRPDAIAPCEFCR